MVARDGSEPRLEVRERLSSSSASTPPCSTPAPGACALRNTLAPVQSAPLSPAAARHSAWLLSNRHRNRPLPDRVPQSQPRPCIWPHRVSPRQCRHNHRRRARPCPRICALAPHRRRETQLTGPAQRMFDLKKVVARDGIEPPTPAFSGPRSTTELSGLGMSQRHKSGIAKNARTRHSRLRPGLFRGASLPGQTSGSNAPQV